jgi:hypothetical protein
MFLFFVCREFIVHLILKFFKNQFIRKMSFRKRTTITVFDISIKVIWKANIVEFWIKYFHLICHLILTHTEYIYIFCFSSTEHCAWAIISPKEFKSCVTHISFALLYWKTVLINMHTDLQISSCWEHISTWNMHE